MRKRLSTRGTTTEKPQTRVALCRPKRCSSHPSLAQTELSFSNWAHRELGEMRGSCHCRLLLFLNWLVATKNGAWFRQELYKSFRFLTMLACQVRLRDVASKASSPTLCLSLSPLVSLSLSLSPSSIAKMHCLEMNSVL